MSDSDTYETAYESSPEAKFESKLNNRMHVMEGDMEKAGEGAPDLAKLLEDQALSKEALPIAEEHHNGIQKQENETVEPVKEDQEEAQVPAAPEIKEEVKEEEETPAPKEVEEPVEEEKPQSRPITPKQEEEPQSSPPPPTPEVSRKRVLDVKEPEPEGSSGSEESDSSRKRNKVDQETETTPAEASNRETRTPVDDERERMISEFVTEVSNSPDSLGEASDRLAKEIESLGELAAAKEMEWNAILRVRKLKEEMLERLLRRKRMHCLEEQPVPERFPEHLNNKVPNNLMMMMMRGPRFPDGLGKQQRPILPKPSPYAVGMNPREGRNGPIVDVKSIIDDYRSRHPESAPRRGRRVRGSAEQRFSSNPSLISMANMALGTGASVRTVSDHVYNMGMEQSRREEAAIKEAVKPNGAKPYPEVTLHPVSPPSLLHQVLTKSTPPRPASFSPTLARLLTAPERPPAPPPHFRPPSRVSIADILSSTKKNRNEITITPVSGTPPVSVKNKEDVVLLDDDDGDGGDRLVIDEGSEEVPQCQGCRHKSAQFVCAGCGNQWYCSRDCQVSAWEEHSEVCTG